MYRNGGAPPALKMWVNGVVWGRKKDNVSRRRDLKRKKLDELRASERKSYERQSAAWARHRGLAPLKEE